MRIRSLHMEHFRKFTERTSLTGLSKGVNVLAECNEFGKSTILAAIRGVLFERHGSRAKGVASMQHWSNKTSPILALEFEVADQVYRIEKRFLHKEPYAKLTMPDGSVHQGDAAEERLQQILNFSRAGTTGFKSEDIGMWGALWVTQREAVDQPDLPSSARQTIHGCLDREVGSLAGGARGTALLIAVRGELAKLENGNGKPVGRHKEALSELGAAQLRASLLEGKRQALSKDIDELASVKRAFSQAESSGEIGRTEEMLSEAQRKKEAAQRYEDREKNEVAAQKLAENQLIEVEREVERRATLQRQMTLAEDKIITARVLENSTAQSLKSGTAALHRQRERVRVAKESCDQAGQALRRARTIYDLSLSSELLSKLEQRLALAEAVQTDANELAARLLSYSVTEAALQALRAASVQLQKTTSALEAQATHVSLDLLPGAASLMRIDGQPAQTSSLVVLHDLVIWIQGLGSITIQPGIKDRETQMARQADEQHLFRIALSASCLESLEQAEEQYAARQHCERDLADARKEVTRHTPADPAQKMTAGIEALRNQIAILQAALQASLKAAGLVVAPEPQVARELLDGAQDRESSSSDLVQVEQAPMPDLEQEQLRALRSHTQAEGELRAAEMQRGELGREYDAAVAQQTPEDLANLRASTANAVVVQRGLVNELRRTKPTDSVITMDVRINRYLESKKALASERTRTQQAMAILESRIEREEGVGIEEQLEEAQRAREDFELEITRFQREIKVLELLRRTLEDAEQKAKERYMAPVIQRVMPYLQQLFPGASIECDEDFHITGMVRDLNQTERFDGLSDGTQEQIAVLTRIAFADMLIDSGRPAMVILDDALAYSDSERLERMFDLLSQAATRMQILILTCRGELFTRLGGNRIRTNSLHRP